MNFSAKRACLALALILCGCSIGHAQVPAQPADPSQAIPAQPVQPAAPAIAPVPASPASMTPSTDTTAAAVPATTGPSISIIADSSLKAVLSELAQTWADSQASSPEMPITLTNAGTMRAKIEAGGVWDLAIDASVDDTRAMTTSGFLLATGQQTLARNVLVIYGRAPLVKDDDLDWFDLVGTEWKKVALGNPDLTASGRVAQYALKKHDLLDDDHKGVYVNAPNETAALSLLEGEKADAAFVYATDLPGINLPGFQAFPLKAEDAPPIFYTAALFRLAKNPDLAIAFLKYISSENARPIWAKYGFEMD
jgi:molybdate transport system substrate-binding protein